MSNLIKESEYGVQKTILIAPEVAVAFPVQIGNTGVSADSNGRKIVKAGTPIGSATNILLNRNTVAVVTNTSGDASKSQGVLLHDVDVTAGTENGTMLVAGYVDVDKLDVTVVDGAKTALTKITFMKGV